MFPDRNVSLRRASLRCYTIPTMSQQLRSGALFASRFSIDLAAGAGGMGTVYRGPFPGIL